MTTVLNIARRLSQHKGETGDRLVQNKIKLLGCPRSREGIMASKEVLILRVDASNSDGECLCTGENRAASRLRKERAAAGRTSAGGCSQSLAEVSIVRVEGSTCKTKKRKANRMSPRGKEKAVPAISLLHSDEEMEVDSVQKTTSAGTSAGQQQVEKDYLAALHLDRALNSRPTMSDDSFEKARDEAIAKSMQEKEYRILSPKSDVSFVMESKVVVKPGPSSSSISPSSSSSSLATGSKEVIPTPLKEADTSKVNPRHRKHPTCWTECPNCRPDAIRKYHLIDVIEDSAEWEIIALPVVQAGFNVTRVRRIQNEMFWQRLCFEKQLMLRERSDVNERFLYHTSRSQTSVICEEGLDQRVSTSTGSFGSGIYFRYTCTCMFM